MKEISIGILLLLGVDAWAGPIIVGYSNVVSVSSFSPSVMDAVGHVRWFFAHASVGENILDGIESLHASNPSYYALTRNFDDDVPPAVTVDGNLYDHYRGNPGWRVKVDDFGRCVSNGWHYPRVDAVMNKFCFIDSDADVNYYINQSSALERANPETRFIYATMPLTTDEDEANYLRNRFNASLRAWVCANNRVLYDIADIEAHDTNGVVQSFVYAQRKCQKLWSGYTTDGGHLTTQTAQQTLAKGFYALGAALINYGIPDMKLQAGGFSDATFQLTFYASSNVLYTVECCETLAWDCWKPLARLAPQTESRTVLVVDCTAPTPSRFYRIAARHR